MKADIESRSLPEDKGFFGELLQNPDFLARFFSETGGWLMVGTSTDLPDIVTGFQYFLEKLLSLSNEKTPQPTPRQVPYLDRILLDVSTHLVQKYADKKIPLLRKLPWPGGKPFAVALTHDVDLTRSNSLKNLLKLLGQGRVSRLGQAAGEMLSGKNRYWVFPELLDFYRQKNWQATFFFLAKTWENFSYRYNIQSPKFRRLLEEIFREGHEIGLHSSLYAFDHPQRIGKEKRRLEDAFGYPVTGVRQHYLRLQYPKAWQYFEEAGFAYDSSCGFNEQPGFRAGTSFPFRTGDLQSRRYQMIEIPFSIMDYAWIRPEATAEDNWHHFVQIANEVQQTGGLLNILWHPSNLAEPNFRENWERMAEWLDSAACYQDTLRGILEWWQQRNEVRLKELDILQDEIKIMLSTPVPIKNLVLECTFDKLLSSNSDNIRVIRKQDRKFYLLIDRMFAGDNLFSLKTSSL